MSKKTDNDLKALAKKLNLNPKDIHSLPALGSDMLYLNNATGKTTFANTVCELDSILLSDMRVVWTGERLAPDFIFNTDVCTNFRGEAIGSAFDVLLTLRMSQKKYYTRATLLQRMLKEAKACVTAALEDRPWYISEDAWGLLTNRAEARMKTGTMFKIKEVITYNPINEVVCLWSWHSAYGVNKMVLNAFKTHSTQKKFEAVSLENKHLWYHVAGDLAQCECLSTQHRNDTRLVCVLKESQSRKNLGLS
jgi:hypothetical protein